MMGSKKPFRMNLYRLVTGDKSLPLPDMLEQINGVHLGDRERRLGYQPYRLEEAIAPTRHTPFWLIDFSKRRYEGGPGKASRETPVESFNMRGYQFAEETAALFDPDSGYVIVQYNHSGPRAPSLASYLSLFNQQEPNFYELQVQLSPDAQARLHAKQIFTRLKIKVAPAKLSEAFKRKHVSLAAALSAQTEEFGGDHVFIDVGLDRSNRGSLNLLRKVTTFIKMANEEPDAVHSLVIIGKDGVGEPIDPVDLISERLETVLHNMPLDEGLRYPKEARYDALIRAYNGWKNDKIIT